MSMCEVCPAMDGLEMCHDCGYREEVLLKCEKEGIHMIPSEGILTASEVAMLGMCPKLVCDEEGGGYMVIDNELYVLYYDEMYDLHYINWRNPIPMIKDVVEIPLDKRVEVYSKVFKYLVVK